MAIAPDCGVFDLVVVHSYMNSTKVSRSTFYNGEMYNLVLMSQIFSASLLPTFLAQEEVHIDVMGVLVGP